MGILSCYISEHMLLILKRKNQIRHKKQMGLLLYRKYGIVYQKNIGQKAFYLLNFENGFYRYQINFLYIIASRLRIIRQQLDILWTGR